ncbi:MAG: Zn-dependent hydrolase, partial [Bacteroidota bacterium]|nr:Zn-dependent hydrolase [Bacteroidota bacterium]
SDFAWMDMKDNTIDFVVGPIENYEDKLFGVKTAHEAFVLVKDKEWTKKLTKFISLLPELQKGLPVDQKYKSEVPASGSDLGVYDVLYYAGDCNAASKTIAINLPNDEEVQLKKGARRIQLKNSMQAKFDKIMMPIAKQLIAKDQLKYVKFDAFFNNTMFHEVAHGLGIKNTLNKKGTVREALKNEYSAIEEGKADILGLYMVSKLREMGQIKEGELMDNYVTFIAGIFRSVRFGAASAHGKANMIRFNYFEQKGAFTRDPKDGTYKINFDKMKVAINELSKLIIELEGNGDYAGSAKLTKDSGVIKPQLQKDLDKLKNANIPIDIIFEQGQLNF